MEDQCSPQCTLEDTVSLNIILTDLSVYTGVSANPAMYTGRSSLYPSIYMVVYLGESAYSSMYTGRSADLLP